MMKVKVRDSDKVLIMSALDNILSDETVQQKIVEAMKIVETDRQATYMLQAGSGDVEYALESGDPDYIKSELSWTLLEMLDIAYDRKDSYFYTETKVA